MTYETGEDRPEAVVLPLPRIEVDADRARTRFRQETYGTLGLVRRSHERYLETYVPADGDLTHELFLARVLYVIGERQLLGPQVRVRYTAPVPVSAAVGDLLSLELGFEPHPGTIGVSVSSELFLHSQTQPLPARFGVSLAEAIYLRVADHLDLLIEELTNYLHAVPLDD